MSLSRNWLSLILLIGLALGAESPAQAQYQNNYYPSNNTYSPVQRVSYPGAQPTYQDPFNGNNATMQTPGQSPNYAAPGIAPAYSGQSSSGQTYPNQSYPGQTYSGQPYAAQTYSAQPYSGQSNSAPGTLTPFTQPDLNPTYPTQPGNQPYTGQGYPTQSYPSQPYPAQGYPTQSYPNQPYPTQSNPTQAYPNQPAPSQPYPNQPFASPSSLSTSPALTPALRHQATDLTNQAYRLSKDGHNEQAIALLKQSIAIDPSSSAAHLNMSVALIALKRYDEALKESSTVLQLDPNEENGYLDYLAAAIGCNRMPDALRVGQEYLKRFPHGSKRTTLANEMVAVAQEMDRRANTKGVMAPPGSPDNYLFYVTPSGKRRWTANSLPLKVCIYSGQNCKGFDPAYETALITSFLNWQNASHGLMRFIPVNDVAQANIECRWTDSAVGLVLAAEAGDAEIVSTNGNINHVVITILTCRPDKPSENISLNLVRQVCLHEIGHALGLNGHSDNAQDIMYCATDPNIEYVELSQRDLNTLFLLYQY